MIARSYRKSGDHWIYAIKLCQSANSHHTLQPQGVEEELIELYWRSFLIQRRNKDLPYDLDSWSSFGCWMAHQPPQVLLFPHEQYGGKRCAYKAASAVARKRRRSKLNDHRRLQSRTTENMTGEQVASSPNRYDPSPPCAIAVDPTSDKIQRLIRPDPVGIRTAVALVRQGNAFAIPTECTYEMVLRTFPVKHDSTVDSQQQPHIYIPADATILQSRLWSKRYSPDKSYGIQNKDASKTIASFSEAAVVLQKISACIWPGPCCVYFPVAQPLMLAYRIHASLELEPNQHYVKFRSPRHPLAIRMCHELGSRMGDEQKTRSKSNGSIGSCSSANSSGNRMLIGYPLKRNGQVVTTSSQVPSTMYALDGEHQTEALQVPTCRESVCWILIDVGNRTLVVSKELPREALQSALAVHSTSEPVQAAVLRKWKVEYRDEPFGEN